MTTFTEEVKRGETLRETGKHQEALKLFGQLLQRAETNEDKALVLAHWGLTHELMGNFNLAMSDYLDALNLVQTGTKRYYETINHLSRLNKKLAQQELELAEKYAKEARAYAKVSGRKDLCWFTHRIFDISYALRKPLITQLHWVLLETSAFLTLGLKDKNMTAKKVWLRDLMKDWTKVLLQGLPFGLGILVGVRLKK